MKITTDYTSDNYSDTVKCPVCGRLALKRQYKNRDANYVHIVKAGSLYIDVIDSCYVKHVSYLNWIESRINTMIQEMSI